MKKKILLVGLLLLAACQNKKNEESRGTKESTRMEFVLTDNDKMEYQDDKYSLVSSSHEDATIYRIYNKEEQRCSEFCSEGEVYFHSVSGDCLILTSEVVSDEGQALIVSLETAKVLKEIDFVNELRKEGDKLYYQIIIDKLPEGVKAPDCPDLEPKEALVYLQECYFDFSLKKEVRTDKVTCQFVS